MPNHIERTQGPGEEIDSENRFHDVEMSAPLQLQDVAHLERLVLVVFHSNSEFRQTYMRSSELVTNRE